MTKRLVHPKVSKSTGLGGALSVLVLGVLSRIHGLDLTSVESGAIAALVTYAASFLPSR